MELRHLAALVTVADAGSVTKAARLLHLVQPAVTRQIRALEDEIGVALFDRTRHGMVPTPAGALLVERARRALREIERARAEIRPDPAHVAGIVTLGILESVVDLLAEALLTELDDRYPGIELRIVTAYSGHLQQWLDAGDVDLSLLYNLANAPSTAVVPLVDERLWVVAPPDDGLVPGTPMSWEAAFEHPLILPLAGHGLRTLVDGARSGLSREPRISFETNSLALQKKLVIARRGWTILPAAGVAAEIANGSLSGAPLKAPAVSRSVVLGVPRVGQAPPAVEAVATTLTSVVRKLVRSRAWPSARLSENDGEIGGGPGDAVGS